MVARTFHTHFLRDTDFKREIFKADFSEELISAWPKEFKKFQIIWALCVISMLCFGAVWSVRLYIEWQEKPVLTTVTTTALPISEVQFPAVVICSEGL